MTRIEIKNRFRQENPDMTANVISNTILDSWCEAGDKEICARLRLIKSSTSFSSVVGTDTYNLMTRITNFYDIDEYPGGGVIYDDRRLTMKTIAQFDEERTNWRTASNGTPYDYARYNQNIILGRKPVSVKTIQVYAILLSDDFDDDNILPFNEYTYLEPFHYSLVLYLTMRAKGKVGKDEDAKKAREEYEEYLKWMKQEVNRGTHGEISFRPPHKGTTWRR